MRYLLTAALAGMMSVGLPIQGLTQQDPAPPESKPPLQTGVLTKADSAREAGDVPQLTPGTLIQSTLGVFLDPNTPTGLTIRMDGALGPVGDKRTFGFDGLAVTSRITPGTNDLGRRLSLLVGAANWVSPAPAAIYPEAYRTTADTATSGISVTSAMGGISLRVLGGRNPTETDWDEFEGRLTNLVEATYQAESGGQRRERQKAMEISLWEEFYRPIFRRPVLQVGAVARLGTAEVQGENTLAAYDAFAVAAAGHDIWDFAAIVHFLRPLNDDPIARHAVSGSLAAFADLDDLPPVTTLGLEVGFGRFSYQERVRADLADPSLEARIEPVTDRLDVTLSFSGLQKTRTAGVGFRYSRLKNSFGEDENRFLVLFSNDFLSTLQRQ